MNTPCSLEHCHTNLFALQSLNDMKWKCFRRANIYRLEKNSSGPIDNYKDPVLIEYWNALREDILCAWRRIPTDDGQKVERELWLFGINEDLPTDLPNLRPITQANGSWNETAMSYDCRTMLFKALHNMIEKYLLSKGFARLNKWFLLPFDDHSDVKMPNFSFNFNFFLHGDNKVCASVDVQCHKPIYHLIGKDLEQTSPINVILAPYGINGMLIGSINREIDTNSFRENWEKNYPIRHLNNLPDFVEVSIGNVRMFYPTCYVYKIDRNDQKISSTNKSDPKKPKISVPCSSTANTRDNQHSNKFENSLIKTFANNLLISNQRNNSIDLEKIQDLKSSGLSSVLTDPTNSHLCRCNPSISINTRSTPFVPFHRRPRPSSTLPIHSSESTTNRTLVEDEILIESTSSPNISANTQLNHNEKTNEWLATTPSSVQQQGPASVLASITNFNSISTNSPSTNPPSVKGIKRLAMVAFEETILEDEEKIPQKQTYDFNRTDSFLQLPLKRFRPDDHQTISHRRESMTTTPEHVYQHGQPTPPSPNQNPSRATYDFDETVDSPLRSNYSSLSLNQSSYYPTEGPSMSDLDTIIDSHDLIEHKSTNLEQNMKSPNRKDNLSLPPPPPISTISINHNIYPLNKSLNGVFHHEIEQIYNTPPGSSSSEKLQVLHSPYAIIAETASHVANTVDTLKQFNQESIIAPFESITVNEQSSYYPINKVSVKKSEKRYESSKTSSSSSSSSSSTTNFSLRSRTFRNWKQSITLNDYSSSPFNNQQHIRQLPTPRSMPTPTLYSPMRSNDIQSSPYLNRSIGSVQTLNSPMGNPSAFLPEIDSLILNVLLNDSILNIYRDINFDSCVLCACTSNELSIHGIDSRIYLEKSKTVHSYDHQQQLSNNNACSCGFSAVVNLRLSSSAGLFYEDEIEITGIKTDIKYRQINEQLTVQLLEFIEKKESSLSPFDYFSSQNQKLNKSIQDFKQPFHQYENLACRLAIEQARNIGNGPLADDIDKYHWLHQWSYTTTPLDSDQQLITMLRSLQPLLVEALKKRRVNGLWSTIDGPLTWKSFHQLLYIQSQHAHLDEQISGPQPIPYVLTGFDQEWMMLAPYGLKFWDKLCLEPYSKRKDISYICLVPDNDYICSTSKVYLRDLSTNYELCRLGTHRPLLKLFPEQGLVRLSTKNLDTNQLPNIDQWFIDNENQHPLGNRLKLYAQILKEKLSHLLSAQSFDSILLDDQASRRENSRSTTDPSSYDLHSNTTTDLLNNTPLPSPSSSSSTPSNLLSNNIYTTGSATADALNMTTTNFNNSNNHQQIDSNDLQAFESFYHGQSLNNDQLFLVIYLVDTFRYELTGLVTNENENFDIEIYVKKAIYRIYMDLIKDLPEKISIRINIQIIPIESILNQQVESDSELRLTQYKRLAFHIYDQLRRTVSYTTRAKSLTGFGPAASEEKMPAKLVMQLYTPAYILSPKSDFRFKSFSDLNEQTSQNGSVLFCSYCLSDDQRYLLASCSDDRGELAETCSINIEIPDRSKRKTSHARKIALQKLWDFIMRIVTGTTMPWRIVIGRLGRLGHGELKYWGIILSKRNLVRCATLIRESCSMCHILRSHDHPVILSACLISMETHPLLTILPESIELGEIRGTQPSNNNNSTMQNNGQILNDLSVTHILTLPTSASVQHVQTIPRANDPRQLSNDNDDYFFDSLFSGLDTDMENMQSPPPDLELANNYGLELNHNGNLSRLNSLTVSQTNFNGTDSFGNSFNSSQTKSNSLLHLVSEIDFNDTPTLHEQPLALGFYVSTIGTLNSLPQWMLQGKYLQKSTNSSSVFKATLHISVPNAQLSDEMLLAQNHDQKSIHPLDSNYTYVVLRNVLESYHRLSWLLIDGKTNERASCLPIHMETLLRLYHAFRKFV